MPNVLEMQIVGDISGLDKSLNEAKKLQAEYTASIERTSAELKQNIAVSNGFKKAQEDLNSEFKKGKITQGEYSKGLENLKRDEKETVVVTANLRKELAELKRSQKDLGGGFGALSKKTADGGNALLQFSRIAQDAPYGIQGIANNITETVTQFGYLSKASGGTGGALKALASSLVGSGGILLAVSLVTSALTYMAQNGLSIGDVFDKLTGTFDENAKSLSELNQEVAKTAGEEIASIKGLVSAASDATLSTEKRLLAVKKLQEEYPSYFGNLTKEQILNGDVAIAVDDVSKALISRARASAIAGKLGENAAARLALEEKREKAILAIKEAQDSIEKSKKDNTSTLSLVGAGDAYSKLDLKVALKAYKDIVAEIRNLDISSKKYSESQQQATKDSIVLLETETEAEKKLAAAKKLKSAKGDVKAKLELVPKLTPVKSTDEELDAALKIMRDGLSEDLAAFKSVPIDIKIPLQVVTDTEFQAYQKKLKEAYDDTKLFADGSGAAISSLASSLATSLQTGNSALDAFVGSVIQGLAEVAAAQIAGLIAQQAVATTSIATNAAVSTGNAVTAATSTAAATGPAAAFVLPALVGAAIGFIAAAFSGIKFAHGGIVPGGSFTGDKIPAMLNSGEAVMNQQQQANTLMAIANGNTNSLQGNKKSGNFSLETKLRGEDIYLSMKRVERKR